MADNNLLEGPAPPTCTSRLIDFKKEGLPEYADAFAMAIDDLVTPEECTALLNAAESHSEGKWEEAMITLGNGEQRMVLDTRNCGRILFDNVELASRIRDRIVPHLPQDIVTLKNEPGILGRGAVRRKEAWQLTRLNERLRFLKYTSGMYFRQHCDGSYVTEDGKETSFLTLHLYLNGDPTVSTDEATAKWEKGGREEARANQGQATAATTIETTGESEVTEEQVDSLELVGGATRFYSWREDKYFDFPPKLGSCIIFQHRNLVHSGEDVIQGTKYTMRTDIMYERVKN